VFGLFLSLGLKKI